MSIHEIVLPETKPETEWVRGRALQKVSPTYDHGALQMLLGIALRSWAMSGLHGRVASEWRFRIAPTGAVVRPLVPDIAFLAYERPPADAARDDVQVPLGAPTVAVEVLSPEDHWADLQDKVATYLSAGTAAVIVVDPQSETISVHDVDSERVVRAGDSLTHASLPGFSLDIAQLFTEAKP